ncbi:MAG: hypothetical protein AB7R89_12230 [Dehalococcoidia bacterium]
MATLRIEIKGRDGQIAVPTVVTALDSAVKILMDLDAAISGQPKGSLDWMIAGLATGSAVMELASESRLEDHNYGPDVTAAFVNGLEQIEAEGATPPYISEAGMQRARRFVKLIGRGGATGLVVGGPSKTVQLTARAAVNIDQLIKVRRRSVGSVEGKIETVSIHGRPHVIVYQSGTRKAITSKFPPERADALLASAKDVMGRRVNVAGVVYRNGRGEPMRVEVREIRTLGRDDELPTIEQIGGSDPDFTGALSTDEYIRSIRVG